MMQADGCRQVQQQGPGLSTAKASLGVPRGRPGCQVDCCRLMPGGLQPPGSPTHPSTCDSHLMLLRLQTAMFIPSPLLYFSLHAQMASVCIPVSLALPTG